MTDSAERPVDGRRPVIVGIDGSANAEHALTWALAKTETFGPVTPVTAYQLPTTLDVLTRASRGDLSIYRTAAEAHLTKAIGDTDPGLLDRARVIEAHPGVGLCEAAKGAELLVVGTRGRSALVASLLGSVSSYCAKHSPVPVAVIPEDFPATKPLANVLVGVDGSENSERALRWTIDHMAPDGRVFAVGALSMWGYMDGEFDPPPEVLEKRVRERVEDSVAKVKGYPYDGPAVEIHTAARDARVALRDMAGSKADLLVVGARGVTGIPFLVLGSVSTALVHHPKVPTVVIPAPSAG